MHRYAAAPPVSFDPQGSLLDFIFVVSDPSDWHRRNRICNPSHYQSTGQLDCWLQKSAAGLYYIPDVLVVGRRIKYGVTSRENFMNDLWHWRTLYVAGRLHKPVRFLISPSSDIRRAIRENQQHAANVAQLLLPSQFTREDLLATIVGLSYIGDFRMGLAEDRQKIQRILNGQADQLWNIYADSLDAAPLDASCTQFRQASFSQVTLYSDLCRILVLCGYSVD